MPLSAAFWRGVGPPGALTSETRVPGTSQAWEGPVGDTDVGGPHHIREGREGYWPCPPCRCGGAPQPAADLEPRLHWAVGRGPRRAHECHRGPDLHIPLTWYKVPLTLQTFQPVRGGTHRLTDPPRPSARPTTPQPAEQRWPQASPGWLAPGPRAAMPQPRPPSRREPPVRLPPQSTQPARRSLALTAVLVGAAGSLLVGQDGVGALGTGHGLGAVAGVTGCGGREDSPQGPALALHAPAPTQPSAAPRGLQRGPPPRG